MRLAWCHRDTVAAVGSKLKRVKGLHKIDAKGKVVPGKVSELIYDFARPLLDAMGPPRNIDDLRNAFMLATLCWNLPVFERTGNPQHHELQRQFDSSLKIMPEPIASLLHQLLEDRKTKFGQIPFWVIAEVRGTNLDDASVHAEARQSSGPRA